MATKTKINEFDLASFVNKDIFQLDVPVSYRLRMKVHQDVDKLFDYRFDFLLWESSVRLGFQVGMKRFPFNMLHHQVDMLAALNRLE